MNDLNGSEDQNVENQMILGLDQVTQKKRRVLEDKSAMKKGKTKIKRKNKKSNTN